MSNGHVLVIAPSPDLRRSLAFALETEGYEVAEGTEVTRVEDTREFDAIVLDHKAAQGPQADVIAFCRRTGPVVLLSYDAQSWLSSSVFRIVPTPLIDTSLSIAVADAVSAGTRAVPK